MCVRQRASSWITPPPTQGCSEITLLPKSTVIECFILSLTLVANDSLNSNGDTGKGTKGKEIFFVLRGDFGRNCLTMVGESGTQKAKRLAAVCGNFFINQPMVS